MPHCKSPGTLSTNQAGGEPQLPCQDSSGILYPVLQIQRNIDFSLYFERSSESSVATLEETPFLLQLKRSPDSPAATLEETEVPHLNSRGVLTPLLPLERNPEIPIAT